MTSIPSPEQLAPEEQPLYAPRKRVYPQAVRGPVRRVKWAVLILCLGLYYLLPWLRWDRGPGMPDQAVLVDMAQGRLFFFWLEIWPQEVYYLTGLLVLGAIAIFAATSVAGRVWCGFACPQTVWTDLFMLVERWIEGDRNARMRRDRKKVWSWEDRGRKAAKHAAWLFIAQATGGAWVNYFNDAPTLFLQFLHVEVPLGVLGCMALFTFTTYLLAGWAREQVCTYMCPWPRFQSAMLDADSFVVAYRAWRGETRGKAKDPKAGDCVDCGACVHACPTGVDIRDGYQMGCIGCGLCIDACDDIMRKLGRAPGLIAFETDVNLAASAAATSALPPGEARLAPGMAARRIPRLIRPRSLMYAGVACVVAALMVFGLATRQEVALDVLRDRQPVYVRLSDGGIRNGYALKLSDRRHASAQLAVQVEGLPRGASWQVLDGPGLDAAGRPLVATQADGVAEWRLLVTLPAAALPPAESTPVTIRLLPPGGGHALASSATVFLRPKP
ncbi:cytochrome c oxidase accessory protein CcoG [Siccirubricoccus sp. KC 17139]|uniref:Cytochrome c oxidase accessory protein CcoG n=1 Tax=Siccirubricoccus soli TaxID=2899147 RepID=A0ABT1D9M7_9PROT|nr:cytochrome c oxidase accessory protein CcoG [Siccirubricoccus soli]MCO6417899.1 cytochrome c oxidase accessory protein CcoG [Siccirubricoccus soli]MCP2684034.1 cytochrome c oxidase accessory protein CcoG [Siccirubricoccus soli]